MRARIPVALVRAAALSALVGGAYAQVEDPQDGIRFGRAVCAIPDQDADGVTDFVVTAPYADCEPQLAGRVFVFSGKEPKLLRSFVGPEANAVVGGRVEWVDGAGGTGALLLGREGGLGGYLVGANGALLHAFDPVVERVFAVGDWNCDGRVDFAIEKEGSVLVLSGGSYEPLSTVPESVRGSLIGTPGDLDADGGGEIILLSTGDQFEGRVWSSRSDRPRIRLRLPTGVPRHVPRHDHQRWVLASVGDVDSDGSLDWGIGMPAENRVVVFSGTTASALLDSAGSDAGGRMHGYALIAGEDLDGDGTADLVIGAPDGGLEPGSLYACAIGKREWLWSLHEYSRCHGFSNVGASLAFLDDRDGDGVREILVGGADVNAPHGRIHRSGNVRILSGATGAELWFACLDDVVESVTPR